MANHSPLSSENHRSLFVKPVKRGKQRAGGEALFALHYFPFSYQPRHTHNYFPTQLRWYCDIFSMKVLFIINVLMVQLGTSCVFDSPELTSESEVYPGSFAVRGNNAVGVVPFIYWYFIEVFHAENVQHLRR